MTDSEIERHRARCHVNHGALAGVLLGCMRYLPAHLADLAHEVLDEYHAINAADLAAAKEPA